MSDFSTYDGLLQRLEGLFKAVSRKQNPISVHEAKAMTDICKTAMLVIERKNKEAGGNQEQLNGALALEAIMKGLTGGVAREILLAQNFKQLETMVIDVTPGQQPMQIAPPVVQKPAMESPKVIMPPPLSEAAQAAKTLLMGGNESAADPEMVKPDAPRPGPGRKIPKTRKDEGGVKRAPTDVF